MNEKESDIDIASAPAAGQSPIPVLSYVSHRMWQPGERNGKAALICAIIAYALAGMGAMGAVIPNVVVRNAEGTIVLLGLSGGVLTALLGVLLGYFGQPVRGPAHHLTNVGFWLNAILLIVVVLTLAAPAILF